MAFSEKKMILASASPRRRELLGRFGLPFEVIPAKGEEEVDPALTPEETVKALSAAKAEEIANLTGDRDAIIIGSDTVVERGGVILGKPADEEDAFRMLSALSGGDHRVWSGVCVRQGDKVLVEAECTTVHFRPLSEKEIRAYIATGEPMDKAGSYGYQGLASVGVESISGDYFNVVGLPLCRLGQMLKEFGVVLL